MATDTQAFDAAVAHAMLYEVGGHWNLEVPGVREGLIKTAAQRRACGYVNDPIDTGGETKFGVASNPNPDLDITNLDWEAAKRVYYRRYWLAANCDDISLIHPQLAVLHFDGAVNHGVGRASKFLQRAVGATPVDGDIGPATLKAVKAMDAVTACNKVCDAREEFYRAIVANKPSQSRFLKGWLRRITEMRAFSTSATFK
jgi:lysozyme family protein